MVYMIMHFMNYPWFLTEEQVEENKSWFLVFLCFCRLRDMCTTYLSTNMGRKVTFSYLLKRNWAAYLHVMVHPSARCFRCSHHMHYWRNLVVHVFSRRNLPREIKTHHPDFRSQVSSHLCEAKMHVNVDVGFSKSSSLGIWTVLHLFKNISA